MKQFMARTIAAGLIGLGGFAATGADAALRSFEISATSSFDGDFTGIFDASDTSASFIFSVEDSQSNLETVANFTRNTFDITSFEATVGGTAFSVNPLASPSGVLVDLADTFRDRFILNPASTPDTTSLAGQTITEFNLTFLGADADITSTTDISAGLNSFLAGDFFDFTKGTLGLEDVGTVTFGDFEVSELNAVIPEPATWVMMILGFGLVGMQLQRRKTGIAAAA